MNDEQEPLRLYTVAEAAAALGTSPGYVYERIRAGELPTVELGTNVRSKLRIRASALDAFIEGRSS